MRKALKWLGWVLLTLVGIGVTGLGWFTVQADRQIDALEVNVAESNAPGRFLEIDGRQLHVLVSGDPGKDPTGAPLLLLHGFSAAGHATWFPWAERLTAERSVLAIDMLNFGRSERVTTPDPDLTHRGQARLIAGVLDALDIPRADIAGWSMGGTIATQFALDHPDRVRSLVFVAAHIFWDRPNPGQFFGDLPLGIGRAMTWNSVGGGPYGFAARACDTNGRWCDWLPLLRIRGTVDGLRAISATPQDSRVIPDLGQVGKPVLVIAGEIDPIVPLADSRAIAGAVDGELYIAEGAGHWPGENDPDAVARRLLDFLAAQASPDQ